MCTCVECVGYQHEMELPLPLPHWAAKRSGGDYMEVGAQLATRDGRRTGNAYVDSVEDHPSLGQLAVVFTDMGHSFKMTAMELAEAFYPPAYVMNVSEARAARNLLDGEQHA